MKKIVSFLLVLTLSIALLAGCTDAKTEAAVEAPKQEMVIPVQESEQAVAEVLTGGVLCLKVNPEIALHYDADGKVVKLEGRNEDGCRILENFADCTGKDMELVLEELVAAIGNAGYFTQEADGEDRKIVLELDPGSCMPCQTFLQDMAVCVKNCVERKCWMTEAETPADRCPLCHADDCDGGKYCVNYDCQAENPTQCPRNGSPCGTCGKYDCEDGIRCDVAAQHNNGHNNKHNGGHHG
jgi:hypothetical protein